MKSKSLFFHRPLQSEWREEVKKHFEKIKSEGTCIHRLDEELIRRRRDELRCAPVVRPVVNMAFVGDVESLSP